MNYVDGNLTNPEILPNNRTVKILDVPKSEKKIVYENFQIIGDTLYSEFRRNPKGTTFPPNEYIGEHATIYVVLPTLWRKITSEIPSKIEIKIFVKID